LNIPTFILYHIASSIPRVRKTRPREGRETRPRPCVRHAKLGL